MGVFSTGQFLGTFAGSFLAGWGVSAWGEWWISFMALFAATTWFLLAYTTQRKVERNASGNQ